MLPTVSEEVGHDTSRSHDLGMLSCVYMRVHNNVICESSWSLEYLPVRAMAKSEADTAVTRVDLVWGNTRTHFLCTHDRVQPPLLAGRLG